MIRSADVLAKKLIDEPQLIYQIKNDPQNAKVLADQAKRELPFTEDKFIYRTVVICLGGTVLLVVLGLLFLSFYAKNLPDSLTAIGSAAVGAIAGLLAPSPAKSG